MSLTLPHTSFLAAMLVASLVGCASTDDRDTTFGSEPDVGLTNADSAAYSADHFTFRKTMNRRPVNDFQFYYKRCELSGEMGWVSKTSYVCSER